MKKIFSLLLCLILLLGSLPAAWAGETNEPPQSPAADAPGDDSTLAGLTVESVVYQDGAKNIISCGIYPAFSSEQTEGVVDVAYGVEEVLITAQPASDTATLEINGAPAAAGVATVVYGRDLAVGDNPVPIKVTAENGSERTYTLHVKRVSGEYALPQTPRAYQAGEYAAYARRLAAGGGHCLALKKDGTVIAWGYNPDGACNVPAGLDNVTALAAGGRHSLALKQDGTVVAWGGRHGESNVPTGLSDVVDISCSVVSAALTKNGRVVVWGQPINDYGQGDVPAGLNEAGDVVDIECGTRHMLALKSDGTVVAWGDNSFGQCDVPAGLDHVVAIAAAMYYSMALQANGTLVIWGADNNGRELENLNLQFVKAIAAGSHHVVALKWDGSLAVWGDDYYDRNIDLSVPLELDREVLAVSSGSDYLLALNEDGTVTAWGENDGGQCDVPQGLNLFTDDPPPYSGPAPDIPQTPTAYAASDYVRAAAKVIGGGNKVVLNMDGTVKVWSARNAHGHADVPAGLNNVKSIAATGYFVMALKNDGTVVVWGDNREGACDVPENLGNVKAVAAYGLYCLALKEDGTVVAWGGNYDGQCDVPEGLSGVKAIAAGSSHCLALKEDGTVAAWGNNEYGQCDVPAGLNDVARVFTVGDCSVALKNDGTVAAWGNNDYGQRDVPPGLNNVVDIRIYGKSCAALKGNGTVVVWGDNSGGRRNVPVGLHDVAAVCGGGLAVKADGTIVTWGDYTKYAAELAAETNVLTISDDTIIYRDGTLKYFGGYLPYVESINQILEGLNVLSGHYFAVDKVELLDPSGQSITSVAGQSGYRINAKIANNYCDPKDGLVIVQVRGGDGATATSGGQVLECVGLAGEIPVDGKTVSTDFTMPGNLSGQAYVDVFVWDGWDTMVPRANPSQNLSFTIIEQ
jgi:alpha-tubulin suppressor-like RCC1 family protein